MNVRIIPRLDIKGPNLVKGIHLKGLRALAKPESFARCYYESDAPQIAMSYEFPLVFYGEPEARVNGERKLRCAVS